MGDSKLKGKVVAVTGGTRGIGFAIAARLLEEGAKVALCGTRRESVESALASLSGKGDAFGIVANISVLNSAKAFVAGTLEHFGRIDVLINNAGVGTFRSVAELEPVEFERMIATNLAGVYYCCHEVLPIFKQQGGGDIVNISSLAGKNAFAGGAAYNASKFGLNGLSEAMMLDHRHDGVRVSCVMPGSVATGFGSGSAKRLAENKDDRKDDWKIAPEDIAEVVVLLLCMPSRTTVSSVEIRPSRPPVKTS